MDESCICEKGRIWSKLGEQTKKKGVIITIHAGKINFSARGKRERWDQTDGGKNVDRELVNTKKLKKKLAKGRTMGGQNLNENRVKLGLPLVIWNSKGVGGCSGQKESIKKHVECQETGELVNN